LVAGAMSEPHYCTPNSHAASYAQRGGWVCTPSPRRPQSAPSIKKSSSGTGAAGPAITMVGRHFSTLLSICALSILTSTVINHWRRQRRRRDGATPGRARCVRRPAPLLSETHDDISVISWNVLADHLVSPRKYPYVHPQALAWPHRWHLLQQDLASFQSDFICLQEVEVSRWDAAQEFGLRRGPSWGYVGAAGLAG
jgi:hypothetical protein